MANGVNYNLTAKERFWYDHIEAARRSDQSLVQYAQSHSLKVTTFYNYRSVLRKKGVLEPATEKSFVKARVTKTPELDYAVVILPTGIRVQIPCQDVDWGNLLKGLCG